VFVASFGYELCPALLAAIRSALVKPDGDHFSGAIFLGKNKTPVLQNAIHVQGVKLKWG